MSQLIQKVVPVIIRSFDNRQELLLFKHPKAGVQLVKGTVEEDETNEEATMRELFEESGINDAAILYKIGQKDYPSINQSWHFYLVKSSQSLPNKWEHFADEEEGLNFSFFWQDIDIKILTPWPEIFDDARNYIKERLQ